MTPSLEKALEDLTMALTEYGCCYEDLELTLPQKILDKIKIFYEAKFHNLPQVKEPKMLQFRGYSGININFKEQK